MLALLATAELLGMSVWFTASALSPELADAWDLSAGQVGWLATLVGLGFVTGTALAAVLNLADVWPAPRYFAASAILAALVNAALLVAPSYTSALMLRFMTGFFLAGVYPPGMKMIATWFRSARGLAIGTLVGALTVGKALPYLLRVFEAGGPEAGRIVVLGASVGAVVAGVLVLALYHEGPFPFSRRPFSWGRVVDVVRDRPTRLATGGYLGHMWELYAVWSTIGLFFHRVFGPGAAADLAAFGMIAAGGLGCVWAGRGADRRGRENTTILMMAISGSCALVLGWTTGVTPWLVVPIALIWGFTIVADSAQFSACVTEVCPQDAVGTALTLQTSVGFALTAVSIQLTSWMSAEVGWGPAYAVLAIGPVFGIWSMARLRSLRARS